MIRIILILSVLMTINGCTSSPSGVPPSIQVSEIYHRPYRRPTQQRIIEQPVKPSPPPSAVNPAPVLDENKLEEARTKLRDIRQELNRKKD